MVSSSSQIIETSFFFVISQLGTMASETQINTEKVCRTCLSEETNMKSVFSADDSEGETLALYEMLISCAFVHIREGDGLPEQVCLQCTQDIIRSFSFKQLCERSDSTLRQILVQPKEEEQEEDEQVLDHITEYTELKPYPHGSLETEISNQNSYEYLEPKIESMDIDMHRIDPLDSEVAADGVKCEISKQSSEFKTYDDDTEQITYPCEECTQCFSSASDLKVHMRTHPNEITKYICKVCHRHYSCASTLSRHMKVHLQTQPKEITKHTCKVCHREFCSTTSLYRHMKIHDGAKRHVCNECGRGFLNSYDLTRHIRVHTGEKPYPCKICSKSFAQSFKLVEHTRAHADEKAFVCSICNKAFSRYAGLVTHKKTHSGIKTHECTVCGKRLCGPGSLAVHMKTHTGVKDHVCSYCGKRFITRCNMLYHKQIHTSEKSCVCKLCGKGFPNQSRLTIHHRSHKDKSPRLKNHMRETPITSKSVS